ncbi:MAG: recombination mediator RecR [Patescibacteria group bacterium]|jgi:recombination protein RecR
MSNFPPSLQNLIDYFSRLPGVGPKTALRFVFYLLKQPKIDVEKFAAALGVLKNQMAICQVCQNFSEKNPCAICSDSRRDHETICVVAEYQDLPVIENTNDYHGTYHVLGGVLDPLHGITPDQLKIKELVARIQNGNGKIKEIILALNPDLEGETTMLYLTKLIKSFGKNIKITRLARGLPMGSDLEYADEVTVSDALKGRKEM